jgi:hypothetical protein
MKKILCVIVGIALVLTLPVFVHAAEFRTGDQVRISSNTPLEGNVYIGGGQVVVASPVEGDLLIGGGEVQVTSSVGGDLFIGGGNIRLEGPVAGDVRIAGGNIKITSAIEGELVVVGGSIEITPEASVAGSMTVGGGEVRIAGTVGSLWGGIGELTIEDTAYIQGDVTYTSEKLATVASNARIDGKIVQKLPPGPRPHKEKGGLAALTGGGILWLISGFIMLLLFIYVLPNKSLTLSQEWRSSFAPNLLWGLIFMIITPIIIILLAISLIGLPLAFGVLLFYPVILYLGKLVATLAIGLWLHSLIMKQDKPTANWLSALIGLLVFTLIGIIPFLGWLAISLAWLAGVGAIVSHDWALYKRLKASREF